jgi:hypothetical protein
LRIRVASASNGERDDSLLSYEPERTRLFLATAKLGTSVSGQP